MDLEFIRRARNHVQGKIGRADEGRTRVFVRGIAFAGDCYSVLANHRAIVKPIRGELKRAVGLNHSGGELSRTDWPEDHVAAGHDATVALDRTVDGGHITAAAAGGDNDDGQQRPRAESHRRHRLASNRGSGWRFAHTRRYSASASHTDV